MTTTRSVVSAPLSKQPLGDEFAMLLGQAIHAVEAYRAGQMVAARNHLSYVRQRSKDLVKAICDERASGVDSSPFGDEVWCDMGDHFVDAQKAEEDREGYHACRVCIQDEREVSR